MFLKMIHFCSSAQMAQWSKKFAVCVFLFVFVLVRSRISLVFVLRHILLGVKCNQGKRTCARALCEKTSKNSWHAEPRELAREDERRQSDDAAAEPAAYRERQRHNGPFCFENFPLCLHHHRSSVNNIAPWLVLNTHCTALQQRYHRKFRSSNIICHHSFA